MKLLKEIIKFEIIKENFTNDLFERIEEAITPQGLDHIIKKHASNSKDPQAYMDLLKHAAQVLGKQSAASEDDLDMALRSHSAQKSKQGSAGGPPQAAEPVSKAMPASQAWQQAKGVPSVWQKAANAAKGLFKKKQGIDQPPVRSMKPAIKGMPPRANVPSAMPSLSALARQELEPKSPAGPKATSKPMADLPDFGGNQNLGFTDKPFSNEPEPQGPSFNVPDGQLDLPLKARDPNAPPRSAPAIAQPEPEVSDKPPEQSKSVKKFLPKSKRELPPAKDVGGEEEPVSAAGKPDADVFKSNLPKDVIDALMARGIDVNDPGMQRAIKKFQQKQQAQSAKEVPAKKSYAPPGAQAPALASMAASPKKKSKTKEPGGTNRKTAPKKEKEPEKVPQVAKKSKKRTPPAAAPAVEPQSSDVDEPRPSGRGRRANTFDPNDPLSQLIARKRGGIPKF